MTLKNKLEVEIMDLPLTDDVINAIGIELEQIAEEFAIGFAEWCLADFYISLQTGIDAKADTIEQLLEIYKKERGL